MDMNQVLLAFSAARQLTTTLQSLINTAQQNKELTPEQEAQWKQEMDAYRTTPAGTPTEVGKL